MRNFWLPPRPVRLRIYIFSWYLLIGIKTLEEVEKAKEQILHLRSRRKDQIIGLISRPLEVLKSQYSMIYDILQECPETEENILVLMRKYGNLGMYSIGYTAQKGFSFHTLTKCLEVSSKEILQELLYTLRKILKKPTKRRIGELQVSVKALLWPRFEHSIGGKAECFDWISSTRCDYGPRRHLCVE